MRLTIPSPAHLSLLVFGVFSGCSVPREAAVVAPTAGERCTILAVGRQGYGNRSTRQVAAGMERVAAERGDVNFALLLGDNFFPAGVWSVRDLQWRRKFENLYGGTHLRGMPFFALLGNHDHQGDVAAQVEYSRSELGSGRWRMDAPFRARDFGEVDGAPLLRIVFLDSVALSGLGTFGVIAESRQTRERQLELMRSAFAGSAGAEPRWRLVASHDPASSATSRRYSRERTMEDLLPVLAECGVDLFLSAGDRFQQIHDLPGATMHLSTGGGGRKLERVTPVDSPTAFVRAGRGFALVTADAASLKLELFDADGALVESRERLLRVRLLR